jgi:predicted CXXCH cytochrome family protein
VDPTLAVLGSHHSNDMSAWNDGSTVAKSYRFLEGVKGLEDGDYEFQPTSTAHNKYYGFDRTSEADSAGTISSHCGRCHNDFHNGSGVISSGTFTNNVWLRHPTDYDMSNARSQGTSFSASEYASYNDYQGAGNPYSVISPVATADTTTTVNSVIYDQANDAIVMCLSCHRAHGSQFDGGLRWDYKNWPGTGFNGCAICHTAKD